MEIQCRKFCGSLNWKNIQFNSYCSFCRFSLKTLNGYNLWIQRISSWSFGGCSCTTYSLFSNWLNAWIFSWFNWSQALSNIKCTDSSESLASLKPPTRSENFNLHRDGETSKWTNDWPNSWLSYLSKYPVFSPCRMQGGGESLMRFGRVIWRTSINGQEGNGEQERYL